MNTFKFDLNAYFQRINYRGDTTPNIDTLKAVHHAQLYTIPFENFDIQLGRSINLAQDAIFEKLVSRKRGGYCFELNGLFLMTLQSLGYKVRPLLARVHVTGTPTGRGHQLELITIDGKQWIADVGFGGDTPRTPIPLELDTIFTLESQTIRLVKSCEFGFMLQSLRNERWNNLYSFDLEHVCQADIDFGNHFTSTHPSSFFTYSRVASLPVTNGAITLLNFTLKKVIDETENLQELPNNRGYLDALRNNFGINLNVSYQELLPLPKTD